MSSVPQSSQATAMREPIIEDCFPAAVSRHSCARYNAFSVLAQTEENLREMGGSFRPVAFEG